MAEEQLDYEECGEAQNMQHQGSGTIHALADDEMMGEDDDYDDLYSDVNVGEGFMQLHRMEAPAPLGGLGSSSDFPDLIENAVASQELNIPIVSTEGNRSIAGASFPEKNVPPPTFKGQGLEKGLVNFMVGASGSKEQAIEMTHEVKARDSGFQGSTLLPKKTVIDSMIMPGKIANESTPVMNAGTCGPRGGLPMTANQMSEKINTNAIVNYPTVNDNQVRPDVDNGPTMLFVGELHWWTTDAELESVASQYGKIKEIKFFDERASGKSKGYCQVEFYDPVVAASCKEGMNGHVFNGRACVVAFASPQTMKQVGASYISKTQAHFQSQLHGRRSMNDGPGRGGGMSYSSGDAGRSYGRGGGWGGRGQGSFNRGPSSGTHLRGRGGSLGPRGMVGNGAIEGGYGQGFAGPTFGGSGGVMMHPQSVMGAGFDPTYMGRGAGFGGFSGPAFPGMVPPFPSVNTMGLAGVAPHINPAFFGRGMAPNGMGMIGSTGMDGHQAGMWSDTSMGGWGGEEHGRRTRESSYGGDDGASEYGYAECSREKGLKSSAASRDKERGSEHEWSSERKHREERGHDWDRSERDYRYRDNDRDYRHKEHEFTEDDWNRGQSSSRSRSKSKLMSEADHRSRSRDGEYGKKRRFPSE